MFWRKSGYLALVVVKINVFRNLLNTQIHICGLDNASRHTSIFFFYNIVILILIKVAVHQFTTLRQEK